MSSPKGCKFIDLRQKELSGGKVSKSDIDRLADVEEACLTISGLRQDTLEYLVVRYGYNIRELEFWKCPHVPDLSPLEDLTSVYRIRYFWNQKAERLWNLSKNHELKELALENFKRVRDLNPIKGATHLRRLFFGNMAWGKFGVLSLEPLVGIRSLADLEMNPKVIEDNQAWPITRLPALKKLEFNNRLFTTEKVAWLKAHLRPDVESERLAPVVYLDSDTSKVLGGDTMVVGKRKPVLHSEREAARISRYIEKFNALVEYYRSQPEIGEPE